MNPPRIAQKPTREPAPLAAQEKPKPTPTPNVAKPGIQPVTRKET